MNGIDVFCVAISVCEQYTAQMTRGMLYMAVTVIPVLHARSDSFSQTVSHLSLAYLFDCEHNSVDNWKLF